MDEVIHGDCLTVLKHLPEQSVHLVYMDPPFFTQKTHTLKSRSLKTYSFADHWTTIDTYIDFLRERLLEIKRVMRDTASVFVHCDRNASHHIRLLMDDVLGADHFLSEIIWTYRRWSNTSSTLLPAHQGIFMYSKSQHYTFNRLTQPYSQTTNLDQILQKRVRDKHGKTVYAEDETGQVILNGPKQGVPLSDVWEIPYLNPKAKERTGYPTQKPLLLLERIIELASNPGDLVLDPFCGSGTTLVAAKLLHRHYIGVDISKEAVALAEQRLNNPVKTESAVLKKGREAYDNLPDYVQNILSTLPVKVVQRNAGIDAIYDQYVEGRPVVVRVQRHHEPLQEAANKLHKAGQKKNAASMILIRTHEAMTQTSFASDLMPQEIQIIDSAAYQVEQALKDLLRL